MHKKVQSLLITGVLSANMVGSTISVFADDTSKKKIVRYVLKNDRITNKEACELLDIKDSRAYKLLREMNESGILKKEGSYRDSYYRIAEDKRAYHA